MQLRSLFPVIVTPQLSTARAFYVQHFGFRVVFDAGWYVHLHGDRSDGGPPLELAFMVDFVKDQPPELHAAFSGAGMVLTVDVQDARQAYRTLESAGVLGRLVVDLRDEPWGQRHFLFADPIGMLVDVVQLIPPSPGYAAAYSKQG